MKLLLVIALVIQATIISSATVQNGGTYKIIPKGSGQVLGIDGNSNAVGADIRSQPDQTSNYQRFQFTQTGTPNDFYIQNLGSNLWVSNFVSPPRQANFNPSAFYQNYEMIPAAGGYYIIRPVASQNNVMTRAADGSLSWQPRTGADNQLFFLFPCRATTPANGTVQKLLSAARLSAAEDSGNPDGIDLRD